MHRLEITGTTPEELLMNALRMLTVLLNGGARPTPAAVQQPEPEIIPSSDNGSSPDREHDGSTPSEGPTPAPAVAKGKRGRPRNADKASETPADLTTEKTVELNDDISDVGGADVKRFPPGYLASGPDGPAKFLTLNDDIKPRLQAIQKACTVRGLDMASTVNYILKLYGPFGITKADQLKPEQFAEFLEASEAYLSGEA